MAQYVLCVRYKFPNLEFRLNETQALHSSLYSAVRVECAIHPLWCILIVRASLYSCVCVRQSKEINHSCSESEDVQLKNEKKNRNSLASPILTHKRLSTVHCDLSCAGRHHIVCSSEFSLYFPNIATINCLCQPRF